MQTKAIIVYFQETIKHMCNFIYWTIDQFRMSDMLKCSLCDLLFYYPMAHLSNEMWQKSIMIQSRQKSIMVAIIRVCNIIWGKRRNVQRNHEDFIVKMASVNQQVNILCNLAIKVHNKQTFPLYLSFTIFDKNFWSIIDFYFNFRDNE